ncbi:MAG: helix-turn-helix domain-containing protein, partial [Pseudonocardiaceae bacterium]
MGSGHADDIARQPRNADNGTAPPWCTRPEARKALAERDIGAVYRLLYRDGVSQREIARRTGQSQSEVSEIMHRGRQVRDITVLERIADGLGVPRPSLRLLEHAPGDEDAYGEEVTVAETSEEVGAEMLRRHLIALGGVAIAGATVAKLGELLAELPGPPPLPLPSRLDLIHVAQVRDLTRRLGEADNHRICDAEVLGAAAAWATLRLDVPGTEPVKRALKTAVAELHIEAGWAAFDVGLYRRALYHYARALELAIEAGDVYPQALALNYAGIATVEHGEPNEGLKLLQLGRVKAWDIPPEDQRAVVVGESGRAAVQATALAGSATALADLGHLGVADTDMA